MFSLNLPAFEAKIITRDGKRSIFDVIRRPICCLDPGRMGAAAFRTFSHDA